MVVMLVSWWRPLPVIRSFVYPRREHLSVSGRCVQALERLSTQGGRDEEREARVVVVLVEMVVEISLPLSTTTATQHHRQNPTPLPTPMALTPDEEYITPQDVNTQSLSSVVLNGLLFEYETTQNNSGDDCVVVVVVVT
ncbi:hypothetical protein E2C01_044943 [Portunus trituberculatus]|uniref:Uncharacterized protein n=1 Tax=Portunus trituberculatus TaxID=210409 RepID=A0A5B7G3P8_PORTR|nr:hypothetical protein [Portunus trituberculatus]